MTTVRLAVAADADALAALAARTLRESYGADHDAAQLERHIRDTVSPDRIAAELADPAAATFLLLRERRPVGYALLRAGPAPACVAAAAPVELQRIYVSRDAHRTGAGSALLRAALDESVARARDVMWLSVWDRNDRARAFYRRWAFRDVGTMPFVFGGVTYEDFVMARPVLDAVTPRITVSPVRADEGSLLRRVRLAALRDAPDAFLTTAAEAERMPAEDWDRRARLSAEGVSWRTFLARAGDRVCGMASGVVNPDRPDTVELIQMWVDPAWRKRSVGRRIVEAVLAWGGERADVVRLTVADDQPAAVALYRSAGFLPTGETEPHPRRPGVRLVALHARLRPTRLPGGTDHA